jgi:hypothetical protein
LGFSKSLSELRQSLDEAELRVKLKHEESFNRLRDRLLSETSRADRAEGRLDGYKLGVEALKKNAAMFVSTPKGDGLRDVRVRIEKAINVQSNPLVTGLLEGAIRIIEEMLDDKKEEPG